MWFLYVKIVSDCTKRITWSNIVTTCNHFCHWMSVFALHSNTRWISRRFHRRSRWPQTRPLGYQRGARNERLRHGRCEANAQVLVVQCSTSTRRDYFLRWQSDLQGWNLQRAVLRINQAESEVTPISHGSRHVILQAINSPVMGLFLLLYYKRALLHTTLSEELSTDIHLPVCLCLVIIKLCVNEYMSTRLRWHV